MENLKNKKILLIICGGIAAYKSLELIRLLKKNGSYVKTILTNNAKKFVTPLSVVSLSQEKSIQNFLILRMSLKWIIYLYQDGLMLF